MRSAQVERYSRFAFAVLLGAILVYAYARVAPQTAGQAVEAGAVPRATGPGALAIMVVQLLIYDLVPLVAIVLTALAPAVLLGLPAGLRPGSYLDRVLQAPAVILLALPPAAAGMIGTVLLYRPGGVPSPWLLRLGVFVLAAGPWLARAVRDGVAGARSADGGITWRRATTAVAGRILQQTGNLLMATMSFLSLFPLEWLGGRDHYTQLIASFLPGVALAVVVAVAAFGHLAGDGLVARTEQEQPPARFSRAWLAVGAVLVGLLVLVAVASFGTPGKVDTDLRLLPPGPGHWLGTNGWGEDLMAGISAAARLMLTGAFGTTVVAAAAASLISAAAAALGPRVAPVLTPRVPAPSLLALYMAAVVVRVLAPTGADRTLPLIVAMGLSAAPQLAWPLRLYRMASGRDARRGAIGSVLGTTLVVFGEALVMGMLLGIGQKAEANSLISTLAGAMLSTGLKSAQAVSALAILAATAAGTAGCYLAGLTLIESAGSGPAGTASAAPDRRRAPDVDLEPGLH